MRTELARPSDLPELREMIRALSAFHNDEAQVTLERLQHLFFAPDARSVALVARDGPRIVGYAGLNLVPTLHSGAMRLDIQHLFVVDTHRAKGVGRALIDLAATVARDAGAKGMTIGTDPNNLSAQAAYRAMGLEEITDAGPRFWIPLEGQ